MWLVFALLSAIFAALTSILAKMGIDGVNSNLATAIRTAVVVIMAWGMVFLTNTQSGISEISKKSWVFLILSGLATGASWLCYYRALQMGDVSKVVPIDKLSIVLTMILAFFLLHEQFTVKSLVGCILIGIGTFVMVILVYGVIHNMKANKVKKDSTIGIFSSSSPVSATVPVRYNRGKEYLTNKGFHIIDGALYGKQDFYRSGSIQERANEFNQLLYNEEVKILMAAIGGNNTNSILPYIDYDYLKKHPKIIVGYSDTTALLLAIYAKTGLITFYGPALASSFGELPPFVDWTFDSFQEVFCHDLSFPYTYQMPSVWTDEFIDWSKQDRAKEEWENDWVCVLPGVCKGRLIGGNLNTMEGFFGTEYMPEIRKGDILLIEDSLKDACTIERTFSMLKLAGVLDKISGIILGKHEKFDDNGTGRKPYEILLEVLNNCQIPFLAEFDCCHTHPMFTMPIGCQVELNATDKTVKLLESPLK